MSEQSPEEKKSSVKFIYYNIRGLGQPIRYLLYYIGVDFDDIRLERDLADSSEKLQSTFNSGLPKFEDEKITLSDSVAISFYICQKYNYQALLGYTPRQKAKINQIMFKYWFDKAKVMPNIFSCVVRSFQDQGPKKQQKTKEMLHKLAMQNRFIFYCLKKHKKTEKWIIKQSLTIVDFFFYDFCFYIVGFFKEIIQKDNLLSGFLTFYEFFHNLPFMKKYKKKINEVKLFFPFEKQNYSKAIIESWDIQNGIKIF